MNVTKADLGEYAEALHRDVLYIKLENDWTQKHDIIKAVNGIDENADIKTIYCADENITYVTIVNYDEKQCEFSSNGSCILECICCNGYGDCKGGASL